MAGYPYVQLYIADYLGDTAHLSTEEHGAYLLLIFNYWQRGKALDNTNNRLAHVTKLSEKRWIEVQKTLAEFFEVGDDQWFHIRIEQDIKRIDDVIEARSRAGKLSGEARRSKRRTPVPDLGTGVPDLLEQKGTIRKDKKRKDKSYSTEFETWWSLYPRRDGSKRKAFEAFEKALTRTDLNTLINEAKKYAGDPNRDPAYTKMGATWLNQDCWEAEPAPSRKQVTRHQQQAQEAISLAESLRSEGR